MCVAGKAVSMLSDLSKIIKRPLFLQSSQFQLSSFDVKNEKFPFHRGRGYELLRNDSSSVKRHCME